VTPTEAADASMVESIRSSSPLGDSPFDVEGHALVWKGGGETIVVEPWGADSLRVRATRAGEIVDADFALLPPPTAEAGIAVGPDGTARISSGKIVATLHASVEFDGAAGTTLARCRIEFTNRHGKHLLSEIHHGGSLKYRARSYRALRGEGYEITAAFESDPGETLVGMGQYQQDLIDIKGATFELAHRNSQVSIPFVLSSAGYGFLWHNPAIGRATFSSNRTEWVAETSDQIDYWITAGDTPAQITRAYAAATGYVPRMPEYGLGFWQSKLRYWNQEQLLEVAREHKRRELPLDVIVADFFHWPKMGDYRFDPEFWPDPAAMTRELAEMGTELMVSIWPQVSLQSENYESFRATNALVRTERGMDVQMGFQGPSVFIDPTSPQARTLLWDLCRRNYHDLGVRLYWLDEAEPEYGSYDFDNYRYHLGSNSRVGNIYPQAFARAFYEGQRAAGQEDVVNLIRCAWAGSQRYGALVWSGDIASTFDDLRRQVVAGIHIGVAGIPWFTTDIGGFHHGDIHDPDFHELLIRWFQFGTFCPVMRMHGDREPYEPVSAADGSPRARSGAPNELWSFGEDVYAILARYVRLRERLRPYLRSLMDEAHSAGQPVMRGMFHQFSADPRSWHVADQYMLGPDLLVAPVVTAGALRRRVYLPPGCTWRELATGIEHQGGQDVDVDAPLDVIPVFLRDGRHGELLGAV